MQSLTSKLHMHLNTLHSRSSFLNNPSFSTLPSFISHYTLFSTKTTKHTIFAQSYKMPVAAPFQSSTQYPYQHYQTGMKQNSPSTGQILAVVTLLPVTGALLGLAGIILVGTLIGLAVATPLFVIFSPILIPAAILLAGTVTAFLTSGAFGLTGLSSLSWVVNMFRQATGSEPMEYARRKMQDAAVGAGERTRQTGEMIKSKAQTEGGREGQTRIL